MTTLEKMIEDALADPYDVLACYAVADAQEERGSSALAFAWRWMGWWKKRPAFREGKGIKKPWAWYKIGHERSLSFSDIERLRYFASPSAWLNGKLFERFLAEHPHVIRVYDTAYDAILDVAFALSWCQDVISKPEGVP